jgi:hypothetical protein
MSTSLRPRSASPRFPAFAHFLSVQKPLFPFGFQLGLLTSFALLVVGFSAGSTPTDHKRQATQEGGDRKANF